MLNRLMKIMACGVLGLGLAATPGMGQVKKREKAQQKRIKKGVKDGELTNKEAAKLEAKEAELHREIKKDRKDGPGLTPRERAKINRKQDKLSREIYNEKHDAQKQ